MNIFFLDRDIEKAAKSHIDKHIVKMPLETAQIICTAAHIHGIEEEIPYKPCHENHPCTKWAVESKDNLKWLIFFGFCLCREYTYRYEKKHACEGKVLEWAVEKEITSSFPSKGITERPLAMPDNFKCEDPVKAYRSYYKGDKKSIASWKKREEPYWWD